MKPLLLMITLVVIIKIILHRVSEINTEHFIDPVILTVIALAYFAACLVIITRTRLGPWSILGAGLLATMAADATLYTYLLAANQHWNLPLSDEWVRTARALVAVGGPFVLAGLIDEWRINHREEQEAGESEIAERAFP